MLDAHRKPYLILVVEDEILVRGCAVEQLEYAGFEVIEAANAEEGLKAFEQHDRVTTLFTDINMPGPFNGLALACKIFDRRPDVRLILTSGRAEPRQSEMPPGVRFLSKPYDCNALTDLIRAA